MQIIDKNNKLDLSNTMYPSKVLNIDAYSQNKEVLIQSYETVYGYQIDGFSEIDFDNFYDKRRIEKNQYFCFTPTEETAKLIVNGHCAIFTRIGFKGQNLIGGPPEKSGRLTYIDGCSDSLLVYPPRSGDPSISLLSFPTKIQQQYHTHPSIRLGVIIDGEGTACVIKNGIEENITLSKNTVFYIEEQELHRFCTDKDSLKIIAYHPDGDWGPTDHNHTMLNRTYIK